jgi:hypothetical protein
MRRIAAQLLIKYALIVLSIDIATKYQGNASLHNYEYYTFFDCPVSLQLLLSTTTLYHAYDPV